MFHGSRGSTSWLSGPSKRALLCATLLIPAAIGAPLGARAQEFDEIGGDDVLIAAADSFLPSPSLEIAENGDLYAAVAVLSSPPEIRVFRSEDAGDTWPLWGTITPAGGPALTMDYPVLHVGEGTQNRLYVAYRFRGPTDTNFSICVAWSELGLASGSFQSQVVLSQAGVDFQSPSLHSDEMSNADYGLYLAAMGSGADGGDIWFSRSKDFGAGWQSEYKIFSSTTGDGLFYPEIRYGRNGIVHCVCYYNPTGTPGNDMAVLYRRATGYAAGLVNWGTTWELTSKTNGVDEFHASIAASHIDDTVVIGYARRVGTTFQDAAYCWSTSGGTTWPIGNTNTTPDNQLPHLLQNDARGCIHGWGNVSGTDNFGVGDLRISSMTWSGNLSHVDRDYAVPNTNPGGSYFDINPAKNNRPGFVWMVYNAAGPDSLFFDAAWRTDPGYPNMAPGFPVMVDAQTGCTAPPAICELDGDRESEIIFGTADGNIHVYNHDGTVVPGWPVDIGEFDRDLTIAVGNITGTFDNEVVAGNTNGEVFVFDGSGGAVSRWPVDTGTGLPAYVAIGAITTTERQVVVTSGHTVFLFNGVGVRDDNFPLTFPDYIRGGPAIGDLNGDGYREIVVNREHATSVVSRFGTVSTTRTFPGQFISTIPALGDLDLDGDLEIVVTTDNGRVYALRADGTDFPGWPWIDPAGPLLTSPVLANVHPLMQPEVLVGVVAPVPMIHAFTYTGSELPGFPGTQTPGDYEYASPIADVLDESGSDIVRSAHHGTAYAWNDAAFHVPGWPKGLGHAVLVSPASGDIDGDDKVEVVMVTAWPTTLVVLDVNADVYRSTSNPWSWWTMYGYNPLRQSCLFCDTDAVSGVGGPPPVSLGRLLPPRPNPSSGPVRLRFEIPSPGAVRLDVFDVNGRLVRRLVKSELPAGPHEAAWDGRSDAGVPVAAGSYYLQLTVNNRTESPALNRKVVLLK